jgi:succinate-semialdehyde dehydrogenase/glutarate-semialdehyde dehydrogenase
MTFELKDPGLLKTQSYINGQWINADDGDTVAVINPATGDTIAAVAKCGTAETRRMIEAAAMAQKSWAKTTVKERAMLLRNWFNLIMQHQEDLAQILTAEQGKPLAEARAEVAYGANYVEWFSEESKRVYGDIIPPPANDKRVMVIKQPVGQCHAAIRTGVNGAGRARRVSQGSS